MKCAGRFAPYDPYGQAYHTNAALVCWSLYHAACPTHRSTEEGAGHHRLNICSSRADGRRQRTGISSGSSLLWPFLWTVFRSSPSGPAGRPSGRRGTWRNLNSNDCIQSEEEEGCEQESTTTAVPVVFLMLSCCRGSVCRQCPVLPSPHQYPWSCIQPPQSRGRRRRRREGFRGARGSLETGVTASVRRHAQSQHWPRQGT